MAKKSDEKKDNKAEKTVTPEPLELQTETKNDRINADRVFDACLLLVTVLAAVELAYISYLFPSNIASNVSQVNYYFRITTSVIILLVVGWIIASIVPSPRPPFEVLGKLRRRWLKEFSWNLFANLFVFEIASFIFFAFTNKFSPALITIDDASFGTFFLTFTATWYYWRKDNPESRWKRAFIPIIEQVITYLVALYILSLFISFANSALPKF